MGLFFGKKNKTELEQQQTKEIKEAAKMEEETQFKNPFAQATMQQPPTPQFSQTPPQYSQEQKPAPMPTQETHAEMTSPFTPPQTSVETHPAFQTPLPTAAPSQNLNRDQIQEMIDETVEKIIDERWTEMVSNVEKVVKWKENLENELNMLKEDIVLIKDGFEKLENKLITKISSYDKNIIDVNAEIKALEKVFQKITPALVNNINELSKITKKLKGEEEPTENQ